MGYAEILAHTKISIDTTATTAALLQNVNQLANRDAQVIEANEIDQIEIPGKNVYNLEAWIPNHPVGEFARRLVATSQRY